MNSTAITYIFFGIFFGQWIVILVLDSKYAMLRDNGTGASRPFSWSRVQMTWWTVIVLTAFATAVVRTGGTIPILDNSTLYLLGISSATTISSTMIDVSDRSNPSIKEMAQDLKSAGMILDILSDKSGINIHRFQTFLFNVLFGVWFMYESLQHLFVPYACKPPSNPAESAAFVECLTKYASSIMPVIAPNNLVLLAASSGVYTALKTTENKLPSSNMGSTSQTQADASATQPTDKGIILG